jgi:hypothetical protein
MPRQIAVFGGSTAQSLQQAELNLVLAICLGI